MVLGAEMIRDLERVVEGSRPEHGTRHLTRSVIGILLAGLSLTPGSARASAPSVTWIDQFGSRTSEEGTWGLDVFGNDVFTGGKTFGTLPGQTSAGDADGWIRRTDARGTAIWTVQFGTRRWDNVEDVDAVASGVYVVGGTWGPLGGVAAGGTDGYLTKFDPDGHELWATQFGTPQDDWAISVVAGPSGIYVYGQTYGAFPGFHNSGDADLYVAHLHLDGSLDWIRQFGSPRHEEPWAVESANNGIYIDGYTNGRLPGAGRQGGWDAYVAYVAPGGRVVWIRQFGSKDADFGYGLTANPAGDVYVSGQTFGVLTGSSDRGGSDGFVWKFSPAGATIWSRQFGTSADDSAGAVVLVRNEVVAAGVTGGNFAGQTNRGADDAFVRALGSASGDTRWTLEFGTTDRETLGWAWGGANHVFAIGDTEGTFPDEVSAGNTDTYLARIDASAGR
jgi:hypothetical protein